MTAMVNPNFWLVRLCFLVFPGLPSSWTTLWLALLVSVSTCFVLPPDLNAQQDKGGSDSANQWATPEIASLPEVDELVGEFMDGVGATAATVAISRRGRLLYSKGYGHSDRRRRVATSPRTIMRIASCSKPFTAAAIRQLIEQGEISLETKIFDFLEIQPDGQLADPRVKNITVSHLLNHKGGWNRAETIDPMYELEMIKRELRVTRVRKHHIVKYMWSQPLQSRPGDKRHYSNFGYLLLGMVVEKATGDSYVKSVRNLVADSIDAADLAISSPVKSNRKSREVHYPQENQLNFHIRDSASGLATNSQALCKFMSQYWLDGKPLTRARRFQFQIGTHPFTTTTVMEQRLDEIHYAINLNARRNDDYREDNQAIRQRFNELLDSIKGQLIDP